MQGELGEVRNSFIEEELVIISVGIEDLVDDDIRYFRSEHGGDWIYAKGSEDLIEQYGVNSVPTECIIDEDGYLRFYNEGSVESAELSDVVEDWRTLYIPPDGGFSELFTFVIVIVATIVIVVVAALVAFVFRKRGKEEAE